MGGITLFYVLCRREIERLKTKENYTVLTINVLTAKVNGFNVI